METQPEYVFIWLGLAKLRVTTALVNTNLRGAPLTHCLKIAGCKALIFGDEMIGGEFGQKEYLGFTLSHGVCMQWSGIGN